MLGYCNVCKNAVFVAHSESEFWQKSSAHIQTYHTDKPIDKPLVERKN